MAVPVLTKKVKISKNRKTYWRKHVNLNDVEEFLEEERQNERFGGAAADKPDDQLFVVENKRTGPSSTFARGQPPVLRCFQNLQPDSAVAPPIKPHQLQGVQGKAKVQPSWLKEKKQKTSSRACALSLRKKGPAQKSGYDLWSAKPDDELRSIAAAAAGVEVDYLPDAVTRQTVKVPEYRYQKPSLLAAVETPHPGASYNPTHEDHQALLMSAHQVEVKRQKEEDYLTRSLTSKFPKQLPTQAAWLEEMSAGLFEAEKDEEEEEQENDQQQPGPAQTKTWGQPVSFHSKKTKAERNQEKALKNEKKKLLVEKVKRRRLNDLNSVKALKKQLVKAEKISEERLTKRERKAAEAMYQPRRLGPCKYAAPDLEVQLPQDLPDKLRTLKMEGHLVEDRFKSLQRRNLIEPRQRQKAPKKKVKVLLRRTHRD